MPQFGNEPGQRTGITTAPRDVLLSDKAVRFGRGKIDAANSYDGANTSHEDEMRPGLILAMITATKLWVPCKRTKAGTGATSTSLPVTDARTFKVGETITVGSNTAITISAINYLTNILTVSSITWTTGDAVFCDSLAGSDIARQILNNFVKLKDEDGVARNKSFGDGIEAGLVDQALILGDYATIRAASGMFLGGIQWGDQAGLTP